MSNFDAIIFDFDGVLLESEFEGNLQLAKLLTDLGHRTTVQEALNHFMGLSGQQFIDAIERRIGTTLPTQFYERLNEHNSRALRDGVSAVVGAVDFVRSLPSDLPKAVASSSSTHWIRAHLNHLGLAKIFGDRIYSGKEHVARGKPAPDIYLHAATELGVDIRRCAIVEDSEVGVTGALASGATVIGLVAGSHCMDGHDNRLRAAGVDHVAYGFEEVGPLLGLS